MDCEVFREAFGADVAHNDEAVAKDAVRHFADVGDRGRALPAPAPGTAYPKSAPTG